MKIAVFGWYGHNNAGDERIKYCLQHFLLGLGGIKTIDFYDLHNNAIKGKTNQFDHYNLIIIGGGGLILSQCNYHDFIAGINTKIVTVGVSIEHHKLTGNAKRFALALLNKSITVLVRDQSSAEKLLPYDHMRKVKVSNDLTFLKPYDTVNITKNNIIGINLLPKPSGFGYSTIYKPFIWFFINQLRYLGINNILKAVDFKSMINVLTTRYSVLPIPLYYDIQKQNLSIYQKNDVEFLKLYFQDVPQTFSDKAIDECSVFLAMRLHGAIFAVQKGIPIICFPYLPKNKSFMTDVGLENFVIESIETNNLLSTIEHACQKQGIIRAKMKAYKEKASSQVKKDLIETLNLI